MSVSRDRDYQKIIFDSLLEEYSQCMNNYAYRDELVPNEFNFVLVIIAGLTTILEKFSKSFPLSLMICLIGGICIVIFYWDLINTCSAKKAAGIRAYEIENILSHNKRKRKNKTDLQLAHQIDKQKFYWELKFFSKLRASDLIVWCTRILTLVWVIYSIYHLFIIYHYPPGAVFDTRFIHSYWFAIVNYLVF